MGDRALVQMVTTDKQVSPVLYLHWDGDNVEALIRDTADLMKGRNGDLSYSFARLVGMAHEHRTGNLSVGVWNYARKLTAKDSHGDAGCFIVNVDTWDVDAVGGYGKPFNARS
jgi:hypothetical protein